MRVSDWLDVGLEGRGLVLQRAVMDARSLRAALGRDPHGRCWPLAARCDGVANEESRISEAIERVERRRRQGHDDLDPLLACVAHERKQLAQAATAAFEAVAHRPGPTSLVLLLRALAEELRAEAPLEQAHRQLHLERWLFRAVALAFGLAVPVVAWWEGSLYGTVPTMFDVSAVSDSSSATAAFTMAGLIVISWQVRRMSWNWLSIRRTTATRSWFTIGAAGAAIIACWAGADTVALCAAAVALVLSARDHRDLTPVA